MTKDEALQKTNETIRGFQRSRALITALELDVFTTIGGGADTPQKIARRLGADPRGTRALLRALAGMGYLRSRGGRFGLNDLSAPLDDPARGARTRALLHAGGAWERWSRLGEAVLKGKIAVPDRGKAAERRSRENFIAAMESGSLARARPVAKRIAALLRRAKTLLDVGCGSGGYSREFLRVNPALTAVLFDRPEVLRLARGYARQEPGLARRMVLRPGDFLKDDLGGGYDLVFASSIVHIYSPATNERLLRAVRGALVPGGRVVLADFFLDGSGAVPVEAALFGLHMLVSTKEGGTYTAGEVKGWLARAGFSSPRTLRLPGPARLIVAVKPS